MARHVSANIAQTPVALVATCCLCAFPLSSSADRVDGEHNSSRVSTKVDAPSRLIVKRRDNAKASDYLLGLPGGIGEAKAKRGYQPRVDILELPEHSSREDAGRALRLLSARSDIEYAVLDQRRRLHAVPSDSLYTSQWYLQDAQSSAIAANTAWDITTGGAGTVVAVLDTGVRFDHPDLQRAAQMGKVLPGYDFVSGEGIGSFLAANDGNGWDADPSDPGDWIDSNDTQQNVFSDCEIENSSWHGTRISGLIGAASDNGIGIAGVSWGAYILPVRVLGKCGGYDSDILPAMRWAAGLHVSGVPDNPYPAKILNLSFGSADPCNAAYESVLQELAAIGVTVVVSAGNDGGPVGSPANCANTIAVAGIRHAGTKVGYSNLGPDVDIAAPAGNCVNLTGACLFSLNTTYDIGRTIPSGPGYTDQFNLNIGTSFSAPLTAGVVALMHAVNARLTSDQMRTRLQEGARAFPNDSGVPNCHVPLDPTDLQQFECNCTTTTCGAGMLHAPGAVRAAQRPIAALVAPTTFAPASIIAIDATTSAAACNRNIASFNWEVVGATGTSPPTLGSTDQSSLQVTAPLSGSYMLRVTVTDDQGTLDTADITIASTSSSTEASPPLTGSACPQSLSIASSPTSPPVTPSATNTSRGGGGSMQKALSLFLILSVLARSRVYKFSSRSHKWAETGKASI